MAEGRNDSVFFKVLSALRGGRKTISPDPSIQRSVITGVPMPKETSRTVQQMQQDFLDVQSFKIAHDLYSRSIYYDADRITSYQDYRAMDLSPEVAAALDIMSDECLEASTIIPLLNGKKKTIEELYSEKTENFWVYSFNTEKDSVEPAVCKRVAYKGEQDVYKIFFDDDSYVMATSEHLWLTKSNKTYTKTSELKTGLSIQPFYTRISEGNDRICGYEMILEENGKWEYTHRIVKRKLWPELKGVCHHRDFLKSNNEPSNLQIMNYFDHQKLHSSMNEERWKNDKKYAEKMSRVFSKTNSIDGPYWSNPEWRENRVKIQSESLKKFISSTTQQQRKEIYGRNGEQNGMYGNGHKLSRELNGRYRDDLKRFFTVQEIMDAYQKTDTIVEAANYLKTSEVILRNSDAYRSMSLNRWEDMDVTIGNVTQKLTLEKIDKQCEKFLGAINLARNIKKICDNTGWKLSTVRKLLKTEGFKDWREYVKKFNSKEAQLDRIKHYVLTTPGIKDIKHSLLQVCGHHGLKHKSVEGIISRSKYKNWGNFVDAINHSIKSVEYVGRRKTYDLVDVGEHHNFAVLTSNGTGVFSHNCVTKNERGDILAIYSENVRVKKVLKDLFSNVLNIDFNLSYWSRECLKFGDMFLKLEIDQKQGVYDARMLPPSEIHREEGWDGNVNSSRFRWETNNMYFEEWQVAHFRIPGDGSKLPYGTSVLSPARKLWKQLQLAEDAMLVYRIVRAPERRVYYIEVGNLDPADIPQYIEKVKREIKKSPVVNESSGNINFKFNPITHEEDYFLPIRGDKSSRVETLPGACLALDTKIELLDGRSLELKDIIEEFEIGNKDLWSYSIDPSTGKIVPGKITWAGVTRKNTDVVRITLDNGQTITCTHDHKFPVRGGRVVQAKDLQAGESMWAFNKRFEKIKGAGKKRKRNTYEMVFDHDQNDWVYTHRMVANYFKKLGLHEEFVYLNEHVNSEKATIHHKNFWRYDNSPHNLCFMNSSDHFYYHQDMVDKLYEAYGEEKVSEWKEDRKNGLRKYFASLSESELLKKRETAIENSLKSRDKSSRTFKNNPLHDEMVKRTSEKAKITKNLPENKKRYSENGKKLWKDSGYVESVIGPQRIVYNERMISILSDMVKQGFVGTKDILPVINNPEHEFYGLFYGGDNSDNQQLKKSRRITHNNLYKLVMHFGYENWRDFKNKAECFNHKIVSVEFLQEKMDTGTITIDGDEQFHNFHNFALTAGVFTKNSNLDAIADVEYLQNKLFAALKVPKPYLNYAETIPGGSALAQADLRFSRTINRLQEALLIELRRVANIHLYFLGFEDDLDNFKLALTNPSTQQELLKLEVMKARLEVFKEMFTNDATSPVSYTWAMQYVMGFSESEIKQILRQKKIEKKMFSEIDQAIEEYLETGIFAELDAKFRRPGFVPGQAPVTPPAEGGAEAGGGGGGFGGGGTLGGLGGGLGGAEAAGGAEAGAEVPVGAEAGAAAPEAGAEAGEEAAPEELAENTKLLKRNGVMQAKTRILLENMEKKIQELGKAVEGDDDGASEETKQ